MSERENGHSPAVDFDALVEKRFNDSVDIPLRFFEREAERVAHACWQMARRFHQNGRLLAFGNGAWASDAQHIAVEFVHPVIVGKRALPAVALTSDSPLLSGLIAGQHDGIPFVRQIDALARPEDIAVGFSLDGDDANIVAALKRARQLGLLTVAFTGGDGGTLAGCGLDFCFSVPSSDPLLVQETHETLYHVLWELVHVFFEHEGLLV